jgi:hypothetical protein
MSIKPDRTYDGVVLEGSRLFETRKGTMGYQVCLQCEDGATEFIMWLTDKTKDRVLRDFKTLGVTEEQLKDPSYIENRLGSDIAGREVSFTTKTEEYNGQVKVKVAGIGKQRSVEELQGAAVQFFGGTPKTKPKAKPVAKPETEEKVPIDDSDIPF